jgi:uncharacterized protein YlxW (UPF0749 family)
MSVFTSQIRNKPWVTQITAMSCVLGALFGLSLKTQDRIRGQQIGDIRINKLAGAYAELRETVLDQKKKIADLQANLFKYQKAATDETQKLQLLSADLQKANVLAGMVAVSGPGVVVTLRDAKNPPPKPSDMSQEAYIELSRPYIIHDQDIQMVINELRAAGAEAIAVNDQRVVATTPVRCVGPSVLVNNVPTNGSPVRIQAIGDPDTMVSSLTMTNGVSDQYKLTDPSMFSIDKEKKMTLPACAGATPLRYATPASEQGAQKAQRDSEKAAQPIDAAPTGGR